MPFFNTFRGKEWSRSNPGEFSGGFDSGIYQQSCSSPLLARLAILRAGSQSFHGSAHGRPCASVTTHTNTRSVTERPS